MMAIPKDEDTLTKILEDMQRFESEQVECPAKFEKDDGMCSIFYEPCTTGLLYECKDKKFRCPQFKNYDLDKIKARIEESKRGYE